MLVEPLERRTLMAAPTILFILGATRSGGFLEGGNAAARDAQLADINNTSVANGNTGWGSLASTLRGAGYSVEQRTETKEPNAPTTGFIAGKAVPFDRMDLSTYAAIVFGSNNARYAKAQVQAVQRYVNNGGSALFISDANFGSHWRDAADSDQQFLARFGVIVNQDNAANTIALSRAANDFVAPKSELVKKVNAISGEGMSALTLMSTPPAGVTIGPVIRMRGQVRNNDGVDAANQYQGTLRAATSRDAALVVAASGNGRVAAFFDRNTFFNPNGLGTDINRHNNRQLALNIVSYLTRRPIVTAQAVQAKPVRPLELSSPIRDDLFASEPIMAA